MSPYRYVTQCRTQTAQRLLRNQHLAISEGAYQVGISKITSILKSNFSISFT
ncbi:hypothetical protein [Acaryochloris sp. 'Moss Beach']|uniref:hypothetical protein n=1 Tax=Acaryochloris sp. 'Moss Beach' TaxID=2740837 RepID=UPI001F475AA2|nr:hypothetical protein [Acaryochloris sp. 'Moss Beach']